MDDQLLFEIHKNEIKYVIYYSIGLPSLIKNLLFNRRFLINTVLHITCKFEIYFSSQISMPSASSSILKFVKLVCETIFSISDFVYAFLSRVVLKTSFVNNALRPVMCRSFFIWLLISSKETSRRKSMMQAFPL